MGIGVVDEVGFGEFVVKLELDDKFVGVGGWREGMEFVEVIIFIIYLFFWGLLCRLFRNVLKLMMEVEVLILNMFWVVVLFFKNLILLF